MKSTFSIGDKAMYAGSSTNRLCTIVNIGGWFYVIRFDDEPDMHYYASFDRVSKPKTSIR